MLRNEKEESGGRGEEGTRKNTGLSFSRNVLLWYTVIIVP